METGDVRELLIDAGIELLERGDDVGLRAITRQAGVSHGAPRRHFPTHAALLAAMSKRGFADLAARLDTSTGIEQLARRYVTFAIERPAMFGLMFRHDLLAGSGENLRAVSRPLFDRLVDIAGSAALPLWANVHGIATLAANRTFDVVGGADVDVLVREAVARFQSETSPCTFDARGR